MLELPDSRAAAGIIILTFRGEIEQQALSSLSPAAGGYHTAADGFGNMTAHFGVCVYIGGEEKSQRKLSPTCIFTVSLPTAHSTLFDKYIQTRGLLCSALSLEAVQWLAAFFVA
jgi:hypothetical protein